MSPLCCVLKSVAPWLWVCSRLLPHAALACENGRLEVELEGAVAAVAASAGCERDGGKRQNEQDAHRPDI